MRPLGSLEFTIVELPDELQIKRVRHAGWIERILAPALVPALMVIGWFWQKPALIVGASGLLMLLIFRLAWGHPSVLRVLPDRLITSVYLWNTMETVLTDIETVQWLRGEMFVENGDPDGLYVSCAGRQMRSSLRFQGTSKGRNRRNLPKISEIPSECSCSWISLV
jgi:hypothetical protein